MAPVVGAADAVDRKDPMTNSDQRDFWSDAAGPKWLRFESAMDGLLQPVLDGVLARANLKTGEAVLDVGCGTGASALQLGDVVGLRGHVIGADISGSMLGRAAARAEHHPQVEFIETDAQTHDFESAQFDHLVSRFGVMFFENPVAAFTNMARALKSGGRVTYAAWGQIPANPFFTYPAQAARSIIGAPPKSDPDLPGPFAFRDPERVLDILSRAGLQEARCDTVELMLTPHGNIDDFADMALHIGPAHAAIAHFDADTDQISALHAMIKDVFAPFDGPQGFTIPAQINYFTARAA